MRVARSVCSGRCSYGLLLLACRCDNSGFGLQADIYVQLGLRSSRWCGVVAHILIDNGRFITLIRNYTRPLHS
jgi:hypothetical protein